jgi:hypothetical protein
MSGSMCFLTDLAVFCQVLCISLPVEWCFSPIHVGLGYMELPLGLLLSGSRFPFKLLSLLVDHEQHDRCWLSRSNQPSCFEVVFGEILPALVSYDEIQSTLVFWCFAARPVPVF